MERLTHEETNKQSMNILKEQLYCTYILRECIFRVLVIQCFICSFIYYLILFYISSHILSYVLSHALSHLFLRLIFCILFIPCPRNSLPYILYLFSFMSWAQTVSKTLRRLSLCFNFQIVSQIISWFQATFWN